MTNQETSERLGSPEATGSKDEKCPQCGVVSGKAVLFDLCPNCLLKHGCKNAPAEGDETLEPPFLQCLGHAMRGLFEPIELIGCGGMGEVYKGRQCKLNRIVALKVMRPRAADRGGVLHGFQRFKREARVQARLDHPNVVSVYDFGLAGTFLYLTMDFVDGWSLRQMLQFGRLNPSTAVNLFLQLCDGLQHAHQCGVIHRDIKPENLLVDKQGLLKIADFGLAKLIGGDACNEWETRDDRRLGTPHYMAPEQVEKPQAVDHRADIYSAGVVLYEMLTGELPLGRFSAPSQKARIGASLDAVLFRALEKNSAGRYQDIREFKEAVEAGFKGDETPQKTVRSDANRCHCGKLADQLAPWAEAVLRRLDLDRRQLRLGGQFADWAKVVVARSHVVRRKKIYAATT